MTDPSYTALRRHNERIAAMLADPDCVGELLLVGIALARGVDLNDPAPLGKEYRLGDVAAHLYGPVRYCADLALPMGPGWQERHRTSGGNNRRLKDVLRADIRRYVPTGRAFHSVACGRPRIRTAGLCDRNASPNHTHRLTDPATGERMWVGACNQTACKAWIAAVVANNREECAANNVPVPPANVGGVLERHLSEIDWWALYRWLDPTWTPPPEAEPFRKPTLTLVVGDDDDPEPAITARPTLTVMRGGWT